MVRLLVICLLLALGASAQSEFPNQVGPGPSRRMDDSTRFLPVPQTRQLLKAGVGLPLFRQSTFNLPWKTLGIDVTLEHKVTRWLTFIGGLETNFSYGTHKQLYMLEMPLGLRYYFAIGKRMKQRADQNSFFSPYIGFQTSNVLFANLRYDNESGQSAYNYSRGQLLNHRTNTGNLNESFNMLQFAYFQLGTQFRMSNSNYLDINAAIPISDLMYHKTEYTLSSPAYITIKYGIYW